MQHCESFRSCKWNIRQIAHPLAASLQERLFASDGRPCSWRSILQSSPTVMAQQRESRTRSIIRQPVQHLRETSSWNPGAVTIEDLGVAGAYQPRHIHQAEVIMFRLMRISLGPYWKASLCPLKVESGILCPRSSSLYMTETPSRGIRKLPKTRPEGRSWAVSSMTLSEVEDWTAGI
jgi:hypothetical protein